MARVRCLLGFLAVALATGLLGAAVPAGADAGTAQVRLIEEGCGDKLIERCHEAIEPGRGPPGVGFQLTVELKGDIGEGEFECEGHIAGSTLVNNEASVVRLTEFHTQLEAGCELQQAKHWSVASVMLSGEGGMTMKGVKIPFFLSDGAVEDELRCEYDLPGSIAFTNAQHQYDEHGADIAYRRYVTAAATARLKRGIHHGAAGVKCPARLTDVTMAASIEEAGGDIGYLLEYSPCPEGSESCGFPPVFGQEGQPGLEVAEVKQATATLAASIYPGLRTASYQLSLSYEPCQGGAGECPEPLQREVVASGTVQGGRETRVERTVARLTPGCTYVASVTAKDSGGSAESEQEEFTAAGGEPGPKSCSR